MSTPCSVLASAFVTVAFLSAAPATAQGLWSATLVAGAAPASEGLTTVGYSTFTSPETGSLSDTEFMVDGVSYTVRAMNVQTNLDDGSISLVLGLSARFTHGDLVFTADGEPFVVDDAYYHDVAVIDGAEFDFIVWRADAQDWTDGQSVSVGLLAPESVPVLPVPALGVLLMLLSAAGIAVRSRTR